MTDVARAVSWTALRALPRATEAGVREGYTVVRDLDVEMRLSFWAAGDRSDVDVFGASAATTIVVSGLVDVEQWITAPHAALRYEPRRLRRGRARDLAPGCYRRLVARVPSVVLTVITPTSLAWVPPVTPEILAALDAIRLASGRAV